MERGSNFVHKKGHYKCIKKILEGCAPNTTKLPLLGWKESLVIFYLFCMISPISLHSQSAAVNVCDFTVGEKVRVMGVCAGWEWRSGVTALALLPGGVDCQKGRSSRWGQSSGCWRH